jgi:protein-S-isoprenylcysteine O-methyltransferase Ste14
MHGSHRECSVRRRKCFALGRKGSIGHMLWLKTLVFTLLAPGAVTVLIPGLLLLSSLRLPVELGPARYLGAAPLLVGGAVYLWCAFEFVVIGRGTPAPSDPPRALVVTGLYRFVRNPMYLGILLIVLGEAVWFEAAGLLCYAAVLLLGFHLRVRCCEEPSLRRSFGEAFDRYCARVPRWVPRRPGS